MPSIAIIGASNDRSKFGNKAVRAYLSKGWTVYPINLKEKQIEGLACFASILDVPAKPDYASLYLPPQFIPSVLEQISAKGTKTVYFNPGTESEESLEKAENLGLTILRKCSIRAIGVDPDLL